MGQIIEVVNYDAAVYSLDTTDPVLGGAGGPDNAAAQNLANRTAWLKQFAGMIFYYVGVAVQTDPTVLITKSLAGNFIVLNAAATPNTNMTFTLDALTSFTPGTRFVFGAVQSAGKCITLQVSGTDKIRFGNGFRSNLYLYDLEFAILVATDNGNFELEDCSDSVHEAGTPIDGYFQIKNTVIRNGGAILRADYPRITELVVNGSLPSVTQAVWNSPATINGVIRYPNQGFFGLGDGATTLTLPDDRGMYTRYADMGRGIDISRYGGNNSVGSYESDAVGTVSTNNATLTGNVYLKAGTSDAIVAFPGGANVQTEDKIMETWPVTGVNINIPGANENMVKSNSKLPLLKI